MFRVGAYKSAVEPYLRDDMSEEAREANVEWMGDLWTAWVEDVSTARGLEPEELDAYIDDLNAQLRAAEGQTARMALDAGLVDEIGGGTSFVIG